MQWTASFWRKLCLIIVVHFWFFIYLLQCLCVIFFVLQSVHVHCHFFVLVLNFLIFWHIHVLIHSIKQTFWNNLFLHSSRLKSYIRTLGVKVAFLFSLLCVPWGSVFFPRASPREENEPPRHTKCGEKRATFTPLVRNNYFVVVSWI